MLGFARTIALTTALVSFESFAAILTVGQASANSNQSTVAVPLTLAISSNEKIAALQVDIGLDPNTMKLTGIAAGPAAAAAKKEVNCSPQTNGSVRIIIAGMNQNVMAGGVVATMTFRIKKDSQKGTLPLTLSGPLAADPVGATVKIAAQAGSVATPSGDVTSAKEEEPKGGCFGSTTKHNGRNTPNVGDVLLMAVVAPLGLLLARACPADGKFRERTA